MAHSNIEVIPLTTAIGAEIHGVDLSQPLDDETFDDVHDALLEHHVIFLPDQRITPAQQLEFARRFGEIEPPHPVFDQLESQPEVTLIEQDGRDDDLYNDGWHTDVTFRALPAMASILHCQVTPEIGGDTGWLSLHAAYEALSEPVKDLIENLTAVHDFYPAFGPAILDGRGGMERLQTEQRKLPPVSHPVVRTHPVTGRKGLFVNRGFTTYIEGLNRVESRHLIDMLVEHAEHPNFQVRYKWRPHALAMWDNRCTMHCATSNFTGHRLMHRITVLGDKPYH